jgi:hypothetical protein
VLRTTERGPDRSADVERWLDVIQSISTFSYMGRYCFLYHYLLQGEDDRPLEVDKFGGGRFVLSAGERYTAKICQYVIYASELNKRFTEHGSTDALRSPIPSDMVVDKDLILPIINKAAIVGRYDEIHFSFKTRTGVEEEVTDLEIRTSRNSEWYVPNTTLEVKINYAPWQWAALITGIGLYVLGVAYLENVNSVFAKLVEALAIVLISSLGKDFHLSLFKRIVKWYSESVIMPSDSSE